MKKILDYFKVDGLVGGNQDWFTHPFMKLGGCAAATACDSCIYLALHRGMTHLYPGDVTQLTKKAYIDFAMRMRPYIPPRMQGVWKLSMYIEGFEPYLEDVGDTNLLVTGFSGEHTDKEAAEFIKEQIDNGFPVPYLMLYHHNKEYKDFFWHWFLCYGYEETAEDFKITVATYGLSYTFSLYDLWNTGYKEKGGLIRISLKNEQYMSII